MIVVLSEQEFLASTVIFLVLVIGAIVYRAREKEDDFEKRQN